MALRLAVPAGIVLALVIVIANWERNPVPLVGDWQGFGRIFVIWIIPLSLITGAIAYVSGTRAWNERMGANRRREWRRGVIPIVLAYTALVTAVAIVGVQIINSGFRQLVLDKYQGAMLAGAAGAALLFWMIKRIMSITVSNLLETTIILMVGGIYLTMTNINDPLWWQESFSRLGTLESNTNLAFNITLIFVGIMFLVWMPYLMSDIQILVRHDRMPQVGEQILRFAFRLIAVGIMLVGVFIYGVTPLSSWIHNAAAYSVAGALILLMLGIRWLVPDLSNEFFTTSWILLACVLAALVAAAFGYFNTVGLELISFTLGMVWLQNFVRSVQTHASKLEPEAFPA
ncbi:MAG: hypothetical protein IT328_13520 [Caldilineaceae bacterium]|nr:hypothetical protein [Caldilineaceae bacterium]